ncbi:hypothetical protein LBHB_02850 [Leptospira borgpetersenii serovar Hardjo]|nr:hypothetical protein LBHB_02850 [Leptospira borgpetersenii serovar Hardjo]
MEGRGGGKTREVFFTTKSYFLQVKSLILVGTLEKYQFLILMIIPKPAERDAFVSFTGLLDPVESRISYSELSYVQET